MQFVVVLMAVLTAVGVGWRHWPELVALAQRWAVWPTVKWVGALVGLREPRAGDVQFAVVREIVAMRTVGVTGSVRVPSAVEVFIGAEDWEVIGGAVDWAAWEVEAAVSLRCARNGWDLSEPLVVAIGVDAEVPSLRPRARPVHSASAVADSAGVGGDGRFPIPGELPATAPAEAASVAAASPTVLPVTEACPGLMLEPADGSLPAIVAGSADDSITVGRSPGAGVSLGAPTVSWMHAALFRRGSGWWVEDLCSTNGTFLNGHRMRGSQQLMVGDEVGFGVHITYRVR